MMQKYSLKIAELIGRNNPSLSEKEKKELDVYINEIMLNELYSFICLNFDKRSRKEFEKRIKSDLKQGSVEDVLLTFIRYISRIPHALYKFDRHMKSVLSQISFELLNSDKRNGRRNRQ